MSKKNLIPDEDGVTHINIYSNGKTWLGRELSNFAHRPFNHKEHGLFASVEGYWYWLGRQDEKLRHLYGYKAKQLGQSLPLVKQLHPERFQKLICEALDAKLERHPDIFKALIESTLPIEHYYAKFYGTTLKISEPPSNKWVLAHFEKIRQTYNPEADVQHLTALTKKEPKVKHEEQQLGLF